MAAIDPFIEEMTTRLLIFIFHINTIVSSIVYCAFNTLLFILVLVTEKQLAHWSQ